MGHAEGAPKMAASIHLYRLDQQNIRNTRSNVSIKIGHTLIKQIFSSIVGKVFLFEEITDNHKE